MIASAPMAIHTGLRYQRAPPRSPMLTSIVLSGTCSATTAAGAETAAGAGANDADDYAGTAAIRPAAHTSDSRTPRMSSPPELTHQPRR